MAQHYDLIVIGSGPAGRRAAVGEPCNTPCRHDVTGGIKMDVAGGLLQLKGSFCHVLSLRWRELYNPDDTAQAISAGRLTCNHLLRCRKERTDKRRERLAVYRLQPSRSLFPHMGNLWSTCALRWPHLETGRCFHCYPSMIHADVAIVTVI
jgi:hypothetical protein